MSTKSAEASATRAGLMDEVYRHQRHIYDATRKYFLLGRDELIATLGARPGETVLELGTGTGRNLRAAARAYPDARFLGLDISAGMLVTARRAVDRDGLGSRVKLAVGDATNFDVATLFPGPAPDHVFISYALSMIPDWPAAIACALRSLAPGGTLHIVDFGQQAGWPVAFRALLHAWLARFHVAPRSDLVTEVERHANALGATVTTQRLYRDYAWLVRVKRP